MIKKVYNQEQILKLISSNPGLSSTQLAEKMQLNRVTIFLYLQELQKLQKIQVEGRGKATRYFLDASISLVDNLRNSQNIKWTDQDAQVWKQNIQFGLMEEYDESVSIEDIEYEFHENCMYIDSDMMRRTGFDGFIAWCFDPAHDFSDRIVEKAQQYLDILLSIKARRKKHGFLDATELVRHTL